MVLFLVSPLGRAVSGQSLGRLRQCRDHLTMAATAAIVGTGLVGRAWAIAFARAGWQVRLWDPSCRTRATALATIDGLLADLAAQDMLNGADAADVRGRMAAAATLDEALAGAAWAQENAPEDLAIKRALWRDLDALADPATILASSTSAIVPSQFTEPLAGRPAASSATRSTRPT